MLGAVVSSKLYRSVMGNTAMFWTLLSIMATLFYMAFITSVGVLHVAFFACGLLAATTETGCQIMTRKVHGANAGPWLGANTVAFSISGGLVPLIGHLTGTLFVQYSILAAASGLVSVLIMIPPSPENFEVLTEMRLVLC